MLRESKLCRLGKAGYRQIMGNLMKIAKTLSEGLLKTGHFRLLSDVDNGLPLVAFARTGDRNYDEFALSDKLRQRGWVLPAYTFAPNAEHIKLLRAVVREDLSFAMVKELILDIQRAIDYLDTFHEHAPPVGKTSFQTKHQAHRIPISRKGYKFRPGVC